MKSLFLLFICLILTNSCGVFGSLTSNTLIQPKDSFILGNNEHGTFKVKLKNVSNQELTIYRAPINGGTHSPITVKKNESVTIKVERDTALVIKNDSNEQVSVDLYVTGDTGLSMGYKN
jgi:hypothetical protein